MSALHPRPLARVALARFVSVVIALAGPRLAAQQPTRPTGAGGPSTATASVASPVPSARLARLAASDSIARLALAAYVAHRYMESATLYRRAVPGALAASVAERWYNAACSLALGGSAGPALDALDSAVVAGFDQAAFAGQDADLASLRDRAAWRPRWTAVGVGAARNAASHRRGAETVHIGTDDLSRFWAAYDAAFGRPINRSDVGGRRAGVDTTLAARGAAFERLYLAPGSDALLAYVQAKIEPDVRRAGRTIAERVAPMRPYYDAVRPQVLALPASEPRLRGALARLTAVYPAATFPDVALVVGVLTSGGTSLPQGLVLGVEMSTAPADLSEAARATLPAYAQRVVGHADALPFIIVHELVHANQRPPDASGPLLRQVLVEGGADFLADLALSGEAAAAGSGTLGGAPEPVYRTWGRSHDRAVWARFMAARDSTGVTREWVGNAGAVRPDWVGDVGYYVGAEIARGYYAQAADKRAAVRALLALEDPAAILAASGYAARYPAPAGAR